MKQDAFLAGMAREVARSTNPHFQSLVAWCLKIAQDLKSCKGDVEAQKTHAAVAAATLLLELNAVEDGFFPDNRATGANTPLTLEDPLTAFYSLHPDTTARVIKVTAIAVDINGVKDESYQWEEISIPMRFPPTPN